MPEAPGYNHDWPSDIAIDINGKRIAAMRLEGDYGDRKACRIHMVVRRQYPIRRIPPESRSVHVGVSVDGVLISRETIESQK